MNKIINKSELDNILTIQRRKVNTRNMTDYNIMCSATCHKSQLANNDWWLEICDITKIVAKCHKSNETCYQIFEKLGFTIKNDEVDK